MTGPERERFEILVTAAVDGELDAVGRSELDEILKAHPELRRELEDQMHVKEIVGTMRFVEPPEEIWDRYTQGVLFRLERRIGWVLFTLGAGILIGYGGFIGLKELFLADDVSMWVKGGVFTTLAGSAVLLISVIRERLHSRASDRYDEVIR